MITIALAFLETRLGQMVAGGLGFVALFGWYSIHERNIGAEKARAAIEQRAKVDVERANNAARQSRVDADRGRVQQSPYRRD